MDQVPAETDGTPVEPEVSRLVPPRAASIAPAPKNPAAESPEVATIVPDPDTPSDAPVPTTIAAVVFVAATAVAIALVFISVSISGREALAGPERADSARVSRRDTGGVAGRVVAEVGAVDVLAAGDGREVGGMVGIVGMPDRQAGHRVALIEGADGCSDVAPLADDLGAEAAPDDHRDAQTTGDEHQELRGKSEASLLPTIRAPTHRLISLSCAPAAHARSVSLPTA